MSETSLSVRGFTEKSPEARDLLETVGRTFLTGYGHAAEAKAAPDAEERLARIPAQLRGFAYEGAAMGFAVRDGLPLGGTRHVNDFLAGGGRDHVYMVYVGIGWALARMPRFRWAAASAAATDPLLRWLVLDGYGFHQAYFHTDKYVHGQFEEPAFPWPGDRSRAYASHAIDQGLGRALWFVGGTDAELVATMIEKFPDRRKADLFSGAGLAATYAGGADEQELRSFWERAGGYRPQVAQGCAFACSARVLAGLVVPHTDVAAGVFCGLSPREADELSMRLRPSRPDGAVPAFETWREHIADEFRGQGRC